MKFYFLEALFSVFIVGLGQILKGDGKKGIILLLAFYFTLPAIVFLTLLVNPYLFLSTLGFAMIFGIILWAYNIGDALLRRIENAEIFPVNNNIQYTD